MPPKRKSDTQSDSVKRRKVTLATSPVHVLGKGRFEAWPAPEDQIEGARAFIRACAEGSFDTILVPDKDADGLSSAYATKAIYSKSLNARRLILKRTLMLLGLSEDKIHVHLPRRGVGLFSDDHRTSLEEQCQALGGAERARAIILDQGSRPGRALVRDIPYLILDHHVSTTWPEGSIHVSGCDAQPVPTSSLLAYIVCYTLHPKAPQECDWPALIGIFGDLGSTEIQFGDEDGIWPVSEEMLQLGAAQKRETKKGLTEAVSLLNAPRRTAEFNVVDAWKALAYAKTPGDISKHPKLRLARLAIREEHERCNHAAPKFSKDGRVALLRIDSAFQVHPLVATSWSGTLRGAKKLEMIMCANPGHHPDPEIISFSCRMAQKMRALPADERPNLIELLREYGRKTSETFMQDVGGDFASGHREATGGIIRKELFEQFCEVGMQIGVKPDPDPNAPPRKTKLEAGQKTLGAFFSSPVKSEGSPAKAESTLLYLSRPMMPAHPWCSLFETEEKGETHAAQSVAAPPLSEEVNLPTENGAQVREDTDAMDEDGPEDTRISPRQTQMLYSLDELLKEPVEFVSAKEPDHGAEIKYAPINVVSTSPARTSANTISAPIASTSAVPFQPEPVVSPVKQQRLSLLWTEAYNRCGPGLNNYGNSCYLNAALQALLHTPPLVVALRGGAHRRNDCKTGLNGFCALCSVKDLADEAYTRGRPPSITPAAFIKGGNLRRIAKHLQPGRQEDSHEFLRFCMDAMMLSELVGLNARDQDRERPRTLIQRIFGGRFRSRVECMKCHHPSDTYDYFLDLSLDIVNILTIDQALKTYRQIDHLRGKNQYKCDRCKANVDAEKTVLVDKAPLVLTLHLKRFAPSGRKITEQVRYPQELNLAPIMADRGSDSRYRLYAIVCHSGGGPHSGHYTAYVEAPSGVWVQADDSMMQQGNRAPPLHMKQAYMLFYIKIGSDSMMQAVKEVTTPSSNGLSNGAVKRKADEQLSPIESKRSPSVPLVAMPEPRQPQSGPLQSRPNQPFGPQRPPTHYPQQPSSEDVGVPVDRNDHRPPVQAATSSSTPARATSSSGSSSVAKPTSFYGNTSGPGRNRHQLTTSSSPMVQKRPYQPHMYRDKGMVSRMQAR